MRKSAFGKLPLSFEVNRGQTDACVKFIARGPGYNIFLTPTELALNLDWPRDRKAKKLGVAPHSPSDLPTLTPPRSVLRMNLVGADEKARTTGLNELTSRSNYLIGRDPKRWRTNVPNFGKVHFRNVYPGIDLIYYGNQQYLEYDFLIAPGADPQVIALEYIGADKLDIDAAGNLVLHVQGQQIIQRKPFLYQEVNGVGQPVAGRYVMRGNNRVGVEVGIYDLTKPLVIDPVLVYSTFMGGGSSDQGISIAVDPAGRAYVTGITASPDFPLPTGASQSSNGGSDVFIARLNESGTALDYSTYLGGNNDDEALDIAIDAAGNAYVTGSTNSSNFPTTSGSLQPTHVGGGNNDAFIAKLNPSGAGLIYSTYLGGNGDDESFSLALDQSGNAYMTGVTDSSNFPTVGAYQNTKNSGSDLFVSKLNANGSALAYSSYLGGSGTDWGFDLAVDSSGHAYLTGITNSTNFPTTAGAFQSVLGGAGDAFIAKINTAVTDASSLVYSTYLGGNGVDGGFGIAVGSDGLAYITGLTQSSNFPTTTSVPQNTLGGGSDAFVTKLNANGSGLAYSTYLGGGGTDWAFGIAVDPAGNAYVTGSTESTNFPTVAGAFQSALAGGSDAFVTKVNAGGAALGYSNYLGGSSHDDGFRITLDSANFAYLIGTTRSSNYPTTANVFQPANRGGLDAFVAKVSTGCTFILSSTSQAFTADSGNNSVSVATTAGCSWTATSNASWLIINAGSSGNGNGPVSYSVAANTGTPRIGILTIAGQTFTVTQAAANGCSASIYPTLRPFDSGGGNGRETVLTAANCGWIAVSNATWITITAGDSGTGTGRVRYTVAPNNGNATRTGTLHIAGQTLTITQTSPSTTASVQFSAASYTVNENELGAGPPGIPITTATITINRIGDTAGAANVEYATVDNPAAVPCNPANTTERGTAYARCDYATSLDTLTFAPGETQKTFTVPLLNDVHAEGNETFQIILRNPAGATLGTQTTAVVTIADDDTSTTINNPIRTTPYFVRMQYLDFLSREPELEGFNAWKRVLDNCSDVENNPACDRILVSSSFFGSPEFRLKGFFVFLFYKVSFNRLPEYEEIISDMRRVTGATGEEVFAKQFDFTEDWVTRAEFGTRYNGLSNAAYVDALLANVRAALTTPDPTSGVTRNSLVADLDAQPQRKTRAEVLRAVVESLEVNAFEFNNAFVAMQYYGYLRRKPEPAGYEAWLDAIGRRGESPRIMVNGFMNSFEYRLRFGPNAP